MPPPDAGSTEKIGALAGQKSGTGKLAGVEDEDEDDREVDAEYNFKKMAAVDQAEQLVKNMSFNIDISKLYGLEKTCISNQANPYCPVLLKVNNKELQALYGGQYLV